MPLEEEMPPDESTDNNRWLAWYRALIAGLTGVTVSLLAYFGSATLDELKTIRTEQIAFGQSLAVAASHVDENRAQIGKLWDKNAVTDSKLTDLDRRTSLLEYKVGRR
jgi:hypothetical protein